MSSLVQRIEDRAQALGTLQLAGNAYHGRWYSQLYPQRRGQAAQRIVGGEDFVKRNDCDYSFFQSARPWNVHHATRHIEDRPYLAKNSVIRC